MTISRITNDKLRRHLINSQKMATSMTRNTHRKFLRLSIKAVLSHSHLRSRTPHLTEI